jgi:hypothetical protein
MSQERIRMSPATRASSHEVTRLVRQIQALTLEVTKLEQDGANNEEIAAKKSALEQLRWRLATAARRAAHHDFGAAA